MLLHSCLRYSLVGLRFKLGLLGARYIPLLWFLLSHTPSFTSRIYSVVRLFMPSFFSLLLTSSCHDIFSPWLFFGVLAQEPLLLLLCLCYSLVHPESHANTSMVGFVIVGIRIYEYDLQSSALAAYELFLWVGMALVGGGCFGLVLFWFVSSQNWPHWGGSLSTLYSNLTLTQCTLRGVGTRMFQIMCSFRVCVVTCTSQCVTSLHICQFTCTPLLLLFPYWAPLRHGNWRNDGVMSPGVLWLAIILTGCGRCASC